MAYVYAVHKKQSLHNWASIMTAFVSHLSLVWLEDRTLGRVQGTASAAAGGTLQHPTVHRPEGFRKDLSLYS